MSNKGSISKIYQLTQLKYQKADHPIKNWAENLNRLFQIWLSGFQQTHKKILNITNQGKANANEISPHTCQNGYQKNQQTLARMWRKEGTPVHCWWVCQLVQPLSKTVWRFPKTKGTITQCTNWFLDACLKKYEITNSKWYMNPIFIAALFTTASMWKPPRCSSDVWIKIKCIYLQLFIIQS